VWLVDGERYDLRINPRVAQDRHGSYSQSFFGPTTDAATTVLPAPTSLAETDHGYETISISWTDNHDYGDTKTQYKRTSISSWSTYSTVSIGTEAETIDGLLNGEKYDVRVAANTEHTTTEDA
jgi:hypothetical protein